MSAYARRDREASRRVHEQRAQNGYAEDGHQAVKGEYGKAILFAASDGVLTSFAVISAGAGAGVAWNLVLIMGVGNVFATAFIQGMGEYLASRQHRQFVVMQREREVWEWENNRAGEIQEMMDIYQAKGMNHDDAETIVTTFAKYDDIFVNWMMVEELGLLVPPDEDASSSEAVVMFASFALFAVLPLIGYAVVPMYAEPQVTEEKLFHLCCAVASGLLALLGGIKSVYSLQKWYCAALETLLLGTACSFIAFSVGNAAANALAAAQNA